MRLRLAHLWRALGLGLSLGLIVSIAVAAITRGWRPTLDWMLGVELPYPRNIEVASGWWLVLTCGVWLVCQLRVIRAGLGLRLLALALGPLAAVWDLFSWNASYLLHGYGWQSSAPQSIVQWLLDGPIMGGWRDFSGSVLSAIGLVGAIEPVHFVDGSGIEVAGSEIVLGVVNEALFACMLASLVVITASAISRRISPKPHNTPLNLSGAKNAPAG